MISIIGAVAVLGSTLVFVLLALAASLFAYCFGRDLIKTFIPKDSYGDPFGFFAVLIVAALATTLVVSATLALVFRWARVLAAIWFVGFLALLVTHELAWLAILITIMVGVIFTLARYIEHSSETIAISN